MQESPNTLRPPARRDPFALLALLVIFVVGGLLVGNFVVLVIGFLLTGDMGTFQGMLNGSSNDPRAQVVLLALQAAAAICAFILAPLLYLRTVERRSFTDLNPNRVIWLAPALLTVFLVIAFMPFNALLIEWNRQVDLPDAFNALERWAQQKESTLEELTKRLTQFNSIPALLVGLVVIALIPAVGEELVFRGLVQPQLFALTRNVHAAVWITGFLFSFIHFQFYGLVPRMLLGVLFGYLYAWSGNLWYPIIGHFTNNGFTLIMYYLHQQKTVDLDIENTAAVPVATALTCLVVCIGLLYLLKTYFFKAPVVTS